MRNLKLTFLLALLALIAAGGTAIQKMGASQARQEKPSLRFERVAERMAQAINRNDYAGIGRDFAQVMREALPADKATVFFRNLTNQYGKITRLDSARLAPPNQAVIVAHFERGMLDIKMVLNDEDKIIGLWFVPHKSAFPAPKVHKSRLSLPFRGTWLVFWGGDTKELNYHHDTPNQKFAFDFLGADEHGKKRKGSGLSNEDYFAFGREILAPAEGTVTDVITGVRDNVPGSMNPYSGLGNAVFIRHRSNEVSVLAHFKLGSIKVTVGEKLKAGQLIGLCGNSGNSSEPHLHYHLQNTPIIQDGTGIKCYFQNMAIVKQGKKELKAKYSPVKGDIVVGQD